MQQQPQQVARNGTTAAAGHRSSRPAQQRAAAVSAAHAAAICATRLRAEARHRCVCDSRVRMRRWPQRNGNFGSTSVARSPIAWPKRPTARLRRHKLLSSGVTKGRVGSGSSHDCDRRSGAAAAIRPISGSAGSSRSSATTGAKLDRATSSAFDARPRPACVFAACATAPPANAAYELRCDLEAPSRRHSLSARTAAGRAGAARRSAAGHDTRHERPDHAHWRPDGARHDARLRRRAGDRLSGSAAAVRSDDSQAAAAVRCRRRNRRAGDARRRKCSRRRAKPSCGSSCESLVDAGHRIAGDLPAARGSASSATNSWSLESPARSAFAKSACRTRRAAAEDRRPRRHDGRRCLFESGAARVRRAAAQRRCPAAQLRIAHVGRRPRRGEQFRGKDSILSGPAGGVVGFSRVAQAAGLRPRDRLRHGRHQHRRVSRSTAASSWNTKRRKPACGSSRR